MTAMTASVSATPGPPARGSEVAPAPASAPMPAPASTPMPTSSAPSAPVEPASAPPAPAPATRPLGPGWLRTEPDQPAALALGGSASHVPDLPLVERLTLETGRAFVDHRLTCTAQGAALRPVSLEKTLGSWPHYLLTQHDEATGLSALTDLWCPTPTSLRVRTRVRNEGTRSLHLTALSVLSTTVLPGAPLDVLDLMTAPSAWMAEQRWRHQRLGTELVDVGTAVHGQSPPRHPAPERRERLVLQPVGAGGRGHRPGYRAVPGLAGGAQRGLDRGALPAQRRPGARRLRAHRPPARLDAYPPPRRGGRHPHRRPRPVRRRLAGCRRRAHRLPPGPA